MKTTRKTLVAAVLGTALMGSAAIAGMNGSCGAGKCGGNMKKNDSEMKKDSSGTMMKKEDSNTTKAMASCGGTMSGNSGTKSAGSCGAGKCGSMSK